MKFLENPMQTMGAGFVLTVVLIVVYLGMAGIGAGVDHGAETAGQGPVAGRNLARRQEQLADDPGLGGGDVGQRDDMALRDHQHVGGRHRVDVAKRKQLRLVEHDVGRDLAPGDPAEDATHGHVLPPRVGGSAPARRYPAECKDVIQ